MIDILNKYNIGKKKLIGLGVFLILLVALPLVLLQVQKQQEIRQRAEGLNNVYLELKPSREGKNAIDTQFVQTLYLHNPLNKDISGVDITLTYNNDNLDVIDFVSENNLSYIVKNTNIPGEVHLVGINSRQTNIIDSSIPLGAFILKAKKEGSGTIDFSKVLITAMGETQPLAINPTDNKQGLYTIGKESTVITPAQPPTNDIDDLISHYGEAGGAFDLNNDGIVDGVDYNILLRAGNSNPATLTFIDFIQGSLEQELVPLLPQKVGFSKGLGLLYSAGNFLNDLSLVYLFQKESRIKDLIQQITIYDLVKDQVGKGRSIDEVLDSYKQLIEPYQGRILMSDKGKVYLDNKYNSLLTAYKEKCKVVDELKKAGKKPNAEDEGVCLFPALAEADIDTLKGEEARFIKELGNPEPLLIALAKYDRVVRGGNDGFDEALEVYYELAKRFDEKKEYGSAIEIYDAIITAAPSSGIGSLSKERIKTLNSFGHKSKRVFFHIGASLADPTIILPISICGPGSVGCKLIGKVLLKPGIITKNVAKFGAEKTTQFLITNYGIRREAADAILEASSKLAKDEAGGINFGRLFGKGSKAIARVLTDEEKRSFQKDITEYLFDRDLLNRISAPLDWFLDKFPQYRNYSVEDIAQNVPEYVDFSLNRSQPMRSLITPSLESFNKFLYRGEHSTVGISGQKDINILDLLDIFSKQGGIGNVSYAYVSPDPVTALKFAARRSDHPESTGTWVIKKTILDELKVRPFSGEEKYEMIIQSSIPFKYVEKLLVTREMREKILQKYGAENTQLFGRPIKDVVIGVYDPNQLEPTIRTILELNLKN